MQTPYLAAVLPQGRCTLRSHASSSSPRASRRRRSCRSGRSCRSRRPRATRPSAGRPEPRRSRRSRRRAPAARPAPGACSSRRRRPIPRPRAGSAPIRLARPLSPWNFSTTSAGSARSSASRNSPAGGLSSWSSAGEAQGGIEPDVEPPAELGEVLRRTVRREGRVDDVDLDASRSQQPLASPPRRRGAAAAASWRLGRAAQRRGAARAISLGAPGAANMSCGRARPRSARRGSAPSPAPRAASEPDRVRPTAAPVVARVARSRRADAPPRAAGPRASTDFGATRWVTSPSKLHTRRRRVGHPLSFAENDG